jgi:hypothetical protein
MKNFFKLSFFVLLFYTVINLPAVFALELLPNSIIIRGETNTKTFSCEQISNNVYVFANGINVDSADCGSNLDFNISNYEEQTNNTINNLNVWELNTDIVYIFGNNWYEMSYNDLLSGVQTWLKANNTYSVTTPVVPPTPPTTKGIFLPIDTQTGEQIGANSLMASVGNATGRTVKSYSPVVVTVLAVVLAFLFLRVIIALIYETKQSKIKELDQIK